MEMQHAPLALAGQNGGGSALAPSVINGGVRLQPKIVNRNRKLDWECISDTLSLSGSSLLK